ncbi:MAG TPA: hypothetical protein VII56_01665 [Rhizomicrobium sp.]
MTAAPQPGQMILFDCVEPPLEDGSYRLTVETDVADEAVAAPFSQQNFFDVVGPRFSIPPAMIAGVVPPNNSHGNFQDDFPQIVLSRRALPWERELDPQHLIAAPKVAAGDPPPLQGTVPWVALLVFEEGEYTLLRNIPLQQAVPADVFQRLGSPANITCDAVEADADLIQAILPSLEEVQLLAHVRLVNVNDRELNTSGGDGYYSVVVANRLPSPNAQCRAILVSLEERSDLVMADPPPTAPETHTGYPPVGVVFEQSQALLAAGVAQDAALPFVGARFDPGSAGAVSPGQTASAETGTPLLDDAGTAPPYTTTIHLTDAPSHVFSEGDLRFHGYAEPLKVRLVALTSWKFTCEGRGTFRELMQNLDDAMFGTVADPGHPPLADTGHLKLALQDRVGVTQDVWYRGPLVSSQLTRDPRTYQCADQARRVTPDTGAEDITYAAAFELGRLLAVADARLAHAVTGWRRESCRQSARASTIGDLARRVQLALPADQLHTPMTGLFAARTANCIVQSKPIIADAYGLTKIASAPGLQPGALATAWNLGSAAHATALLGGDPGTLGTAVLSSLQTVRMTVTINTVIGDLVGIERLSVVRQQAIDNAVIKLGGQ